VGSAVREFEVKLPHPALPGSDWADGWQTNCSREFKDARQAAEAAVANFPFWTLPMLVLRQIIVFPFGLKGSSKEAETSGKRIGIFPVVSEEENRLVAGFDDRHLDFRIVIDLGDDRRTVSLVTLIKRHNWVGRAYLQMVLPFHRAIIRSALAKL